MTALPIQNTQGVQSIYPIADSCIEEQLRAILEDIAIDALKIGMLHHPEVVHIITKNLKRYPRIKSVLDPVMCSKNGHRLLDDAAIEQMKKQLFPLVTLITPNIPEASLLLQRNIETKAQMEQAAIDLTRMGAHAVMIKGGHLASDTCDDCLCIHGVFPEIHWFSTARIQTKNTHGTGCTFSAAITAYLSKGLAIVDAVKHAKQYLIGCIEAGTAYEVGKGNGPLHHFFEKW